MAPDWLYDAVAAFDAVMRQVDVVHLVLGFTAAVLTVPGAILVHELGHALAVLARGLRLEHLKVGDVTDVGITLGGVRIELGRFTGTAPMAGFVRHGLGDDDRALRDLIVIALAGPAASALGAVVAGWLALAADSALVTVNLGLVAILSAGIVVDSLIPSGTLDDADDPCTDGRWAQLAWRELQRRDRSPATTLSDPDPDAAASFGPPER